MEVNLPLRGESDVGDKHAYFMHWQNTREELAKLPTPPATETHIPIPHAAVVETLVETLSHRHMCGRRGVRCIERHDGDVRRSRPGNQFRGMPIRDRNSKRKQQAIPLGMHGWAASLRVFQPRIPGRLHPRLGEALEVFLTRRRALNRRGPDAKEFRANEAAGRPVAR